MEHTSRTVAESSRRVWGGEVQARVGLSALAGHPTCHFGLRQMPPSLTEGSHTNGSIGAEKNLNYKQSEMIIHGQQFSQPGKVYFEIRAANVLFLRNRVVAFLQKTSL